MKSRTVATLVALIAVCFAGRADAQSINGSPIVYPLTAVDTATVVIANGDSLSTAATIPPGYRVAAVVMPTAWTAASLTFAVSFSAVGTYLPLYEGGAEYTITEAAASRAINVDPLALYPWTQIKLRSGTAGTPVAQGGARTITLVLRPY